MRETIDFLLNGAPVSVAGPDGWLMLSEFLRRRRALTGTKVVCAEGDCGSCAVLVGRLESGRVVYRSIASCIAQLIQLDATHVVTVEALRDPGELNAFQESMAREHGAQCGFCTPGFVVATQGLMEAGEPVDSERARRGLTGNLCRCTGYDAIVSAVVGTDAERMRPVGERFPDADVMPALEKWATESVLVRDGRRSQFKPVSVDEATAYLADPSGSAAASNGSNGTGHGAEPATLLSGGTDLGVVHNKTGEMSDRLVYLGGVAGFDDVSVERGEDGRSWMVVGAGVTLHRFQREMAEHLPDFVEFMEWFGSPPIRHGGTLAGNLCTASPIGDTLPAMHVLGAEMELASDGAKRTVPIEAFHTGYRMTVLRPGEIVTAIRVPLPGPGEHLRLMKVSRRKDMDISTVSAAFFFAFDGDVLSDVRVAFGGVAGTVERAAAVEAVLEGRPATLERFEEAAVVAEAAYTPMTDVRGSAAYRKALCRNLVLKLWHQIDAGRFAGRGVEA